MSNSLFTFLKVDLFVATPGNIPAESFEVYGVALALVTQAFVGKKPYLIQDADNLFQQLQQTKVVASGSNADVYAPREKREMDFALERGLCALLVGDLDRCRSWLGLDSESSPYRNPSIVEFVLENEKVDDDSDLPGLCKLLEAWLAEVVFPRFRDTKDIQFRLGDYYDDPSVLRYLERLEVVGYSPLAAASAIVKIGAEATAVIDHVKASAVQALRKVFPLVSQDESVSRKEDSETTKYVTSSGNESPVEMSEQDNSVNILEFSGSYNTRELSEGEVMTETIKEASVKIMCAGAVIGLVTIVGLKCLPGRYGLSTKRKASGSALASNVLYVGMICSCNIVYWESFDHNSSDIDVLVCSNRF